jgi:ribosome-associated translation inhibitor RaiA
VSDANGPKGGRDQICKIKVVLSGLPSIVVEEKASVLHEAIDRAMQATALAVRRRVQRRRLKALHHRASHRLVRRRDNTSTRSTSPLSKHIEEHRSSISLPAWLTRLAHEFE